MIIRMVKMTIEDSRCEDFKDFTDSIADTIRGFEGCTHLKILQEINRHNIYFSYSIWETEEDLNNYRNSEFFKKTWSKAKELFCAPPEAWSFDIPHEQTLKN